MGLGCAIDAVWRGYRTLLIEQGDFAGGSSGRSTKFIHGGARYLKQGNISLVRESLAERGWMLVNVFCPMGMLSLFPRQAMVGCCFSCPG